MKIKERERTAILQSLNSGVVPRIGLHHIQVGRKRETEALLQDLARIEDEGSTIRYVIGPFGSGKSFFLNLVRLVAVERRHVIIQADITVDRRFHSTSGQAKALYTELINKMSTKAKPDGGAMPGLVEVFVNEVAKDVGEQAAFEALEDAVQKRLKNMRELTFGVHFIRVLARYVEGMASNNDALRDSALRWLRAEYSTRTEARQDLDVRDIIDDEHVYDMLKVWAEFVRVAGYRGLFVCFDELVVLSERLGNAPARAKNYEILLQILNDCLQGNVRGLGFCFAGTPEFLEDNRRGAFSYEPLKTRLAANPYAKGEIIDMNGPVIRLQPLTQEDLFVLLGRIDLVHANGDESKRLIGDHGVQRFMAHALGRMGAKAFLTPRDTVKEFIGLINVLEQNPKLALDRLLSSNGTGDSKAPAADADDEGLCRIQA
ncbi:MAG: ATP-binding protein [Planctomycetes bacterium]|nr:ATP-binding protein [Planctomycetota bacterium]